MKTLDILIHPFSPFTSEYLYTTTFGDKESILLETWPKSTPTLVNESVEESFDIMNEIVSVCAAARMKGKLKRRWPLKHAIICVEKGLQKKIELLSELLQSQLNVEDYKIIELEIRIDNATDNLNSVLLMVNLISSVQKKSRVELTMNIIKIKIGRASCRERV